MPPDAPPPVRARRIFETSVYGPDLEALEAFYHDVLGLEVVSRFGDRGTALRCGDGVLLLFDPEVSRREDAGATPPHGARGPGHVAFAVDADELPAWRDRLAAAAVDVETEIEWDDGRSIYIRDPAGNSVELATPNIWG